jgi:hypothetical protein
VLTRWIGRGRSESFRDCVRVDNDLLPSPGFIGGPSLGFVSRDQPADRRS